MSNQGTLAVTSDQSYWDDKQVAALRQIGLSDVSKADLGVFLHFCQRTGLDPFARQIYMISRGGKCTIQSSIDGLRIIAQRSGNYGGQTMVEWCGEDGVWKDIWLAKTPPTAARVGVFYKDSANPTYASAKFDSYNANSPIWKKMPDLMIAKCAEALALRKAFPQDLSGIYSSEEMQQADTPVQVEKPVKEKPALAIVAETPKLDNPLGNEEASDVAIMILQAEDSTALKDIWNLYPSSLDFEITIAGEKISIRNAIINANEKLESNER